jgi:DUF4097 and DUF4098 domain-containing protein YvlB
MRGRAGRLALMTAAGLCVFAAGCAMGPGETGSFERTLSVTGPLRLDLENGSGSVDIRAGEAGQVHIRGEVHVRGWSWRDARQQLEDIIAHPPIEQHGNLIHVGLNKFRMRMATISYRIVVPPETELQAATGSGSLEVRGIHGPARLIVGSGGVTAADIREDTQVTAGSGGVTLANIGGEVRILAGSGGITLSATHGDIRVTAGSGGITIAAPGGRINAKTGSGGITIGGAAADLRVATGSGSLEISGDPAPQSYWELHTGSGSIEIGVPASASFRLHAHSSSGSIDSGIPIVVEERTRRELRARAGGGEARIEAHSASGSIHIR